MTRDAAAGGTFEAYFTARDSQTDDTLLSSAQLNSRAPDESLDSTRWKSRAKANGSDNFLLITTPRRRRLLHCWGCPGY